ncbi:substrate-binding domain-containing protein [Pigmentibacter sp. JX0631]|uniref:substrate-binding domain-containing protein n=1 Tax=Pigmentibacter sp. JX0631 TaxID=2976982 RepID=UPI0024689329|nr:substrate-binding domain-containing protein [Pigmentibacter sp. JX0631]WGL59354.1 substrate-binding domain-containing protein [Pigmentibacter sp. JX0631]
MKRIFKIFSMLFMLLLFIYSPTIFSWEGPTTGPKAQKNKKIIFISHDFKNSSVAEVFKDFQKVAKYLKWNVDFIDGKGFENIEKEFLQAIILNPDAIILGGFHPEPYKEIIDRFKNRIVFVGWHSGPELNDKNLFANITTNPSEVAMIAADYVIQKSNQKAGVVILYDKLSTIATSKAEKMRDTLKKCISCTVLAFENLPMSDADVKISEVTNQLNKKFGKNWNYTLAINDLYYDNISSPLKELKRKDIFNISAGDGSIKAFNRIRSGNSCQIATVAEPISVQAWQLADELNRAFAGQNASGYITKPILVTKELLDKYGTDNIFKNLGYEKAYLNIWFGK